MLTRKLLSALAIAALLIGPAFALPTLSAHQPTLTAPHSSSSHTPRGPFSPLGVLGMAGAIRIKDTASIASKFKTRAGAASKDYADGVQSAGADWESGARAGKENYAQGVQEAIARGAFEKGVAAAGQQKYVDNAVKLGAQRYPQGVANAEGAYMKGVQPHLDMMKGLNLSPRGPKGSAQNAQRADAVAKANRALKLQRA